MRLDQQGWREMTTALAAAFGESNRSAPTPKCASPRDGAAGIPTTCALLGFDSPPGFPADSASRVTA